MSKKSLIIIASVVMVVCIAVVGTFAYLTSISNPYKNVFTIGNVDITLEEEGGNPDSSAPSDKPVNNFKLIPLEEITKDAKITVGTKSEDAYIFVVFDEKCTAVKPNVLPKANYSFKDYITYAQGAGFTAVPGVDGVYYIKYTKPGTEPEQPTVYHGIKDGIVTVNDLTDDQIAAANEDGVEISLTVQAGAVQADNIDGANAAAKLQNAWNAIKGDFDRFAE